MSTTEETREGFYLGEDGEWIPDGWELKLAEDVCSLIVDCVNKTAPKVDHPTQFRMIRTTNIRHGRLNLQDVKYVDEETFTTWTRRAKLEKDDVLLTREAPIGEVCSIGNGEGLFLGQRIMQYRADKSVFHPPFLYWVFRSSALREQFLMHEGSGSVVSHIRVGDCFKFKTPTPSLPEQKAIAAVLGSLDDKIELLREQNETLETLAQTLFKRWFIDFNFPDENGNPYKDSGGKMIPSELGEIPEGWNVSNISTCSEHIKISVKPDKHPTLTYNHYSLPAFDNGMQPVNENGSEIKSNKYEVLPKSILVSKLNPGTPRIWQIQLVPENSICSTEFQVVKPSGETFGYVYSAVKNPAYTRELSGRAGGTSSSHQRVSPADIFDVPLAMSENLEFEEQFSSIMGVSLEKLDHNRSKIQTLTALRDTLLPKLMNGEVRVPVDA